MYPALVCLTFNTDDDESEVAYVHIPPLSSWFLSTMYLILSCNSRPGSFLVFPPPPVVFLQTHLSAGVFFSPHSTLTSCLGPSGSRLQSLPTGSLWALSPEVSDMSAAEPRTRPRGNLSRPGWRAEAPGASHCTVGSRAVM